jgi:pimeloyl-ACP methyl ester carboxylesterase
MGPGAMEPLWERLHELALPVLLVAGAEDSRYAAQNEAVAARMPDVRTLVVPGAGHAVHVEAPRRMAAAVDRFLAGAHALPPAPAV